MKLNLANRVIDECYIRAGLPSDVGVQEKEWTDSAWR